MRISRLDLRRFGKFTDQSIPLPTATKDFHLIVGPNEAGGYPAEPVAEVVSS